MKKKSLIITIVAVVILTWIGSSMVNVQNARSREGIILSPNKSKSIEFINATNTSQILMNFHKNLIVGGSNIASGDFDKNEIVLNWKNENTIIFKYPVGTKFRSKEDEIYFFDEIVTVIYKEIDGELKNGY